MRCPLCDESALIVETTETQRKYVSRSTLGYVQAVDPRKLDEITELMYDLKLLVYQLHNFTVFCLMCENDVTFDLDPEDKEAIMKEVVK